MARNPKTKLTLQEVQKFSTRNDVKNWLTSNGDDSDYKNTFTLEGNNPDKSSSKGEINTLTIFGKGTDKVGENINNVPVLDINVKRFYLALYCLNTEGTPYRNNSLFSAIDNYSKNDVLFIKQFEDFLFKLQTGNGDPQVTNGLTTDCVRYYRKDKANLPADPVDNETLFTKLIQYAKKSRDYQKNVAGVLGRVTYDSIVKHTLYKALLDNELIPNKEQEEKKSISQISLSAGQEPTSFVDIGGGIYSRAFPVFYVIFKDKSGKSINDFIDKANTTAATTFSRNNVSINELVKPFGKDEKNFVEFKIGQTGDSGYVLIYDLAKILVLDPLVDEDNTLDLLKIGLSFLTRRQIPYTKQKLKDEIREIQTFLTSNFSKLDQKSYGIKYKEKHKKECVYIGPELESSIAPKIIQTINTDIKNLCSKLEAVYLQIISSVNSDSFYLHFDNFYNLLGITYEPEAKDEEQNSLSENTPFNLSEYQVNQSSEDLVKTFFNNTNELKKYGQDELYSFDPQIALTRKISLISEIFVKQLYEILDTNSKGLVYESDKNIDKDDVLNLESINLLGLIQERTNKQINKQNIFSEDNNYVSIKKIPPNIKYLKINELDLGFAGAKIQKIRLETLSHFLFISRNVDIAKDNVFENHIYYPALKEEELPPPPTPDPSPRENPDKCPDGRPKPKNGECPPTPPKIDIFKKPIEREYLINNIISSELSCYRDIIDSIKKAYRGGDKLHTKTYYIWQSVINLGLPILLAAASQIIASQLSELNADGEELDPDLAQCLKDKNENVKKSIISFIDFLTNSDALSELGLLVQEIPELPKIPNIPYLVTFDAEKELKRKIINWAINSVIEMVKNQAFSVIRSFIDICNADSYLTALLNLSTNPYNENKIATSTPSGLPAGGMIPTYVPSSTLNINDLIVGSGVDSRTNVYKYFRTIFLTDYTDQKISSFFDNLSAVIDPGELSMLLKGSSTIETRGIVLSFIKNYDNGDFHKIFADDEGVSLLFSFLSSYIDYRLCYQSISDSVINYSPNVCFDANSKYDYNLKYFSKENIDDQISDLTRTLDNLCKLKIPNSLDLLEQGPSLFTTNFIKLFVDSIYTAVSDEEVLPQSTSSSSNTTNFSFKYQTKYSKKDIEEIVKSKGNSSLKTNMNTIEGFNNKLKQLEVSKVKIEY